MTPRWHAGVALALMAALLYELSRASDYDEPAYFADVARVQQIRQLDAQWEQDLLKARLNLLHDYDALVAPLADMERLPRQLHQYPANSALAAGVTAYLRALDAKTELVESFKSHNAVFRNSLAYLVTVSNEAELAAAKRPEHAGVARSLREVLLDILTYIEYGGAEEPEDWQSRLSGLAPGLRGGELRRMVDSFGLHASIVLRERAVISRLLADITTVPTGRTLNSIQAVLSGDLRHASQRVRQHRVYLAALSLALSALLLYAAVRLLRSHAIIKHYNARLRQANDTLETAVRLRTDELSQANRRLQAEIDERMQLESRMVQKEKLASIGELAAGVAHEINNPLSFLSSNVGRLEEYLDSVLAILSAYELAEAGLPESALRSIRRLREQAQLDFLRADIPVLIAESKDGLERVAKIVQSLKDFSRAGTAQQWEWADLHRGIESTINIIASDLRKVADVVREYGELPHVECMPSQLNQVIMNLLVNAVHAVGEERGRIVIRSGAAGGEAWFEVQDSGCGIPGDVLPRIFDPFYTTKAIGKGTGLGLSLSYGIVQRHQGRIEVTTAPGEGSTFRVVLPVRRQLVAA